MDSGPESRSLQRRLKDALHALPSRDGGLFLGSGLLLLGVLLLGVSREQHWGERSFVVNLRTPRAEGLKPGMEVRLSGLPVGRVTEMSLQDDASVAIRLRIDERYRRLIGPRSLAYQNQDGLVGDSFIAITPHPQASSATKRRTRAERELTLPYQPSLDLRQVLLDLAQTRMDLTRTLQHTSQIAGRDLPLALSDLRQTLRQTNRLAGQDVPLALGDFRRTMDKVSQLSGTLDRETASTAPRLRQTLSQADRTGEGARLAAVQAESLMRDTGPILIRTLREIQTLTATSNRLLALLLGSRLLQESEPAVPPRLERPTPSRAPLPPVPLP